MEGVFFLSAALSTQSYGLHRSYDGAWETTACGLHGVSVLLLFCSMLCYCLMCHNICPAARGILLGPLAKCKASVLLRKSLNGWLLLFIISLTYLLLYTFLSSLCDNFHPICINQKNCDFPYSESRLESHNSLLARSPSGACDL